MKSEIKRIDSPDISCPIEQFIPVKEDDFGLLLELSIGIENEDGADIFDIMLCTPKWIMSNFGTNSIIVGLHYLIVFNFNYLEIYNKLRDLFSVTGDNWEEICQKLCYYGHWEFQDYKE